jgi:uncharacterized protein (TIGR02145 family)/uncharacterized repeat protein (TIGR02543 family)
MAGDTVIVPGNSGNFEKTEFSFAGWNTRANGTGLTFNQGDTLIIDTGTQVLYAQWTITDIDGNVYKTVAIGNQIWLAEDLRTTTFNDGSAIPLVTDDSLWWNLTTPGYGWYDNDDTGYKATLGARYNWYAVNTGKLAPAGWHVSTDADWDTLQNALFAQGYTWDGTSENSIVKALAAKTGWIEPLTPNADLSTKGVISNDLSKNNGSGFSALPGDDGQDGYWWTAGEFDESDAIIRQMRWERTIVYRTHSGKEGSHCVRCVRNQ